MKSKIPFIIYTALFLALTGCGARKVETSINKSNTDSKESGVKQLESSTKTENIKSDSKEIASDKVNEKQEQRITELFNENGSLKSRIIELINKKSTDKTKTNNKSLNTVNSFEYKTFKTTYFKTITIRIKEKKKGVTTNNNALYWMVFGVLTVALVLFGLYKYFTKR